MYKGDSDSDSESEANGPLHSGGEEEDDRQPRRRPDETGTAVVKRSMNENDDAVERKGAQSAGTKRQRRQEQAKLELSIKREASRLSSLRCQQRKRKRMESLKDEEERLKAQKQSILQQNNLLRLLISTIRQMQTIPNVITQGGVGGGANYYNQGGFGAVQQQQPQFGGVPQIPPSHNLNLSLAMMASMNQQISGLPNPQQLQSPGIVNPSHFNPPPQMQQPFVAQNTIINPATINPQMQINLLQNLLPAQNTLPALQNLFAMTQSGMQQGSNTTQQVNQQQMLLMQQTPQGMAISINANSEEESSAVKNSGSESNEYADSKTSSDD